MSTYLINDSTLSSIADAIRQKDSISGPITPIAMASRIANFNTEKLIIQPYQYLSSTITSFNSDAEYIFEYAFASCYSLTTVSFPKCEFIDNYAFYRCSSLTTISFPNCLYIGRNAFDGGRSLESVFFPSCKFIEYDAFIRQSKLTTVNFPACIKVGMYAFESCSALTTVSLPACTSIAMYAFAYCYNLISLYLTGSSVVSLGYTNVFASTPIEGYIASAGRYGSVYVPSSLLTAYKTASYWSTISGRIVGI